MEVYQKNQQSVAQCYFCGDEMPASQLEMHVKHCGCVLEPCPDSCGLYVQRQYKSHHSNWCKKEPTRQCWQNTKAEVLRLRDQLQQETGERRRQTEEFSQQLDKYREKTARSKELNLKLIDAVTGIRKLVSEEQCARLKDLLEVKTNISEASKVITQVKFTLNQTRVDVEDLRNDVQGSEQSEKIYKQFQEWKEKQDEIVSELRIAINKNVHEEISNIHKDNVVRSKSVNDLLDLNEVIIDTQDVYTDQIYQLEEELKGFKKFLVEENIMISGLWKEQLDEIKKLKVNLEENKSTIQNLVTEQKAIKEKVEQFARLHQDLKNLNTGKEKIVKKSFNEDVIKELIDDRNLFKEKLKSLEKQNSSNAKHVNTDNSLSIVDDTIVEQQNKIAKRLEILEKLTMEIQYNCDKRNSTSTNSEQNEIPTVMNELSSEQAVIKRRLEMLEIKSYSQEEVNSNNKKLSRQDPAVFINGQLMWTISNFNQKLDESKESKAQIESPYFYTSENGYKLQLKAYLNGIGQWEGRHMIVSLHVFPSQWDNRLTWPCRLKVVICLRDQELIHRKAKDIVKSFTSSPASKGFDAPCLQMFIPHRTLYTRSYLKNNVVIIEVKTLAL